MKEEENLNLVFSPTFVGSMLLLRKIPISLVQVLFSRVMNVMHERHGSIFKHMEKINSPIFLIDVVDLPYNFLLDTDSKSPSLKVFKKEEDFPLYYDSVIRGSFELLVKLLEGQLDGDAVFFSRDLIVEGNMEAVVAFRNAIDGEEVDVFSSLLDSLGKIKPVGSYLSQIALLCYDGCSKDLARIKSSITSDVVREVKNQGIELTELKEDFKFFKRKMQKSMKL